MRRIGVFILALLYCCAGGQAASRVAVLTEGKGKSADLASLLEVSLGQEKDLILVERSRIESVLKEQQVQTVMSAEGVGSRVAVGKILQADVLVMLRVKEFGKPVLQTAVWETRQGLRLAQQIVLLDGKGGQATVKAVLPVICAAVARSRQPISTIVAVPPLMCNDLTHQYQHLGAAYARLLEQGLLNRQGTLVVEFAEAKALLQELNFGKQGTVQRQLPFYLLGEYRNSGLADKRRMELVLRLKQGEQELDSRKQQGVVPARSAAAFGQMAEELLDQAGSKATVNAEAELELKQLLNRARQFEQVGQPQEALPLYEASLLLNEHAEGHRGAAQAILDQFNIQWQIRIHQRGEDRSEALFEEMKPLLLVGLGHAEAYALQTPQKKYNPDMLVRFLLLGNAECHFPQEAAEACFHVLSIKQQHQIHDYLFQQTTRIYPALPMGPAKTDFLLRLAPFVQTKSEQNDFASLLSQISLQQREIYTAVSHSSNPLAANLAKVRLAQLDHANPPKPPPPPPPANPLAPPPAHAAKSDNADIRIVPMPLSEAVDTVVSGSELAQLMPVGKTCDLIWTKDNEQQTLWVAQDSRQLHRIGDFLVHRPCWDGRYAYVAALNNKEPQILVVNPKTLKTWTIGAKEGLPNEPICSFAAAAVGPGMICAAAAIGTDTNVRSWVALIHFDPQTGSQVKVFHEARKAMMDKHAKGDNRDIAFRPQTASVKNAGGRQTVEFWALSATDGYDDNYTLKVQVNGDDANFLSLQNQRRERGGKKNNPWEPFGMIGSMSIQYNDHQVGFRISDGPQRPWRKLTTSITAGCLPREPFIQSNHFGILSYADKGQWVQLQDRLGKSLTEKTLAELVGSTNASEQK